MESTISKKIFQLKISIDDSKPLIWRRVHVPVNMSLRGMHRLIQALFSWNSSHLYSYSIGRVQYGDLEFDEFGEMGWLNDQNKTLLSIYEKHKKFNYTYDFGDDWSHTVKIESVLEPEINEKYPLCIGGENPAPPDDCGGIVGYYDMLSTVSDDSNEDAQEFRDWLIDMNYNNTFDSQVVNQFIKYRKKII